MSIVGGRTSQRTAGVMYGVHYHDPLSVDAVMMAASATGSRRPATAIGGSAMKMQNLIVKQQVRRRNRWARTRP